MSLSNTIKPRLDLLNSDYLAFTKIDTDLGVSQYVYNASAADSYHIKFENLVTKENAPVGSKRVQIRVGRTKILPETGASRTAFVSMAVSFPRDASFATAEVLGLIKGLFSILAGTVESGSPASLGVAWDEAANDPGPTFFSRLFTGEV